MNYLNAQPRVKIVSGTSAGAGATELALQPSGGQIWRILFAWAYQTSGGDRAGGWYWKDPDTPAGAAIGVIHAALGSGVPLMFPGMSTIGAAGGDVQPIDAWWATNTSYPIFAFTATAGAEAAGIKALVLEYSGTGKT